MNNVLLKILGNPGHFISLFFYTLHSSIEKYKIVHHLQCNQSLCIVSFSFESFKNVLKIIEKTYTKNLFWK